MTTEQAAHTKPPIGMIVVLVVTVFLYAGMMTNFGAVQDAGNDAMGRGLAVGFAMVFFIAEWFLLAVLLAIGGINGSMPAWSAIAGALLLPISGFSAGVALFLLDRGGNPNFILVPALIPPITAAYAFWARLSALHRALPPLPTSLAVWIAVALIAAGPLPRYAADQAARPAPGPPQKSGLQLLDEDEKRIREETVAKYHALTPDSPLWEWDNYLDDPEFGKQAIEQARRLTHRQVDAEAELRMGIGMPLLWHDELDLQPTPAFCAAADNFLIANAREHRPPAPETDFLAEKDFFTRYEQGMRWLMQSGCNLDAALIRVREAVAEYRETDGRDAYLAHLAAFK